MPEQDAATGVPGSLTDMQLAALFCSAPTGLAGRAVEELRLLRDENRRLNQCLETWTSTAAATQRCIEEQDAENDRLRVQVADKERCLKLADAELERRRIERAQFLEDWGSLRSEKDALQAQAAGTRNLQ